MGQENMSTKFIEEIQARLKAAESGPWKYPNPKWPGIVTSRHGCLWDPSTGQINDDADAEFIAHAPEDIAYLLSELNKACATPDIEAAAMAVAKNRFEYDRWEDLDEPSRASCLMLAKAVLNAANRKPKP